MITEQIIQSLLRSCESCYSSYLASEIRSKLMKIETSISTFMDTCFVLQFSSALKRNFLSDLKLHECSPFAFHWLADSFFHVIFSLFTSGTSHLPRRRGVPTIVYRGKIKKLMITWNRRFLIWFDLNVIGFEFLFFWRFLKILRNWFPSSHEFALSTENRGKYFCS